MSWKLTGSVLAFVTTLLIVACQSDESLEFKRYYSSGALVYQSHCQNCHGSNGDGLSALIPPLSDSTYLKNSINILPCYIKNGLKGQIKIKEKTFDDAMPSNDLSPVQIAEVLTYIGNSFGNKLNTVDEQFVQTGLANCK